MDTDSNDKKPRRCGIIPIGASVSRKRSCLHAEAPAARALQSHCYPLEQLPIERIQSPSRHSKDTALAESKHANVAHRPMTCDPTDLAYPRRINGSHRATVNPRGNLHRWRLFAIAVAGSQGQEYHAR